MDIRKLLLCFLLLGMTMPSIWAENSDVSSDYEQRIQKLEQRIEELENKIKALTEGKSEQP
ncbi:MAG: hypothetical protein QME62_14015, partial [Armatimonadota bacterium]|nr:hypothetical protein [Armatimonadota bacterium]